MKTKLREKISNIVLVYLTLVGAFNGVANLIFSSSVQLLLNSFLLILLLFFNRRLLSFNSKEVIFGSFYLALTFIFLIHYYNDNHYGINKLISNVILTIILLMEYYFFYKEFKHRKFDKFVTKLFTFQICLELLIFIFYVLYNKNNGLLGCSSIQIFFLQDWAGRFQGTFSEPSILGFWLGTTLFQILILTPKKFHGAFFLVFVYILFFACRAKFAMIAFPAAIIASLIFKVKISPNNILDILLVLLFIPFLCIFYEVFISFFFSSLSQFVPQEGSATYTTRFGFIFASIQDANLYPLGRGIGLNYEVFQNIFGEIVEVADSVGFETWEIHGYRTNPNNMGSKDTFSFLLSSFGYIGLFIYFYFMKKVLSKKYLKNIFVHCMVFFIFIESIITTNLFSISNLFVIIFSKMVLNTVEIRNSLQIQ